MTIYEVRQGMGGVGSSLPTIGAAVRLAQAGDEVRVFPGVYQETLRPKQGTTWVAMGAGVVLDGGWDGVADVVKKPSQVTIGEEGVTVRGFVIRNVPGNGVSVTMGGDRFLMEDCTIHDCYSGGFALNGMGNPVEGVTLRRVDIRRVCRSWVVQTNPTNVNGCCLVRWGRNVLFEQVSVIGGYGEGMAAGVETIGMVMRECTVADTMHLGIYASNRAQQVLVEDCVIYHTGDAEFRQGDGDVGAGIVVGDETRPDAKDDRWQHGEDVEIRGCLVVGSGILFGVRNNLKAVPGAPEGQYDGYETRIQNLHVHHNTFVGGPHTKSGIGVNENPIGYHVEGRFEKNVIVLDRMREGASLLKNDAPGVDFAGNAWSGLPAGQVPYADRAITAATAMVDALAEVPDRLAFDEDNYRPWADGPLVVDGKAVAGALEPMLIDEPDPPEPVDWRLGLTEAERVLVANCELYAATVPEWIPGRVGLTAISKMAGMLDEKLGIRN